MKRSLQWFPSQKMWWIWDLLKMLEEDLQSMIKVLHWWDEAKEDPWELSKVTTAFASTLLSWALTRYFRIKKHHKRQWAAWIKQFVTTYKLLEVKCTKRAAYIDRYACSSKRPGLVGSSFPFCSKRACMNKAISTTEVKFGYSYFLFFSF